MVGSEVLNFKLCIIFNCLLSKIFQNIAVLLILMKLLYSKLKYYGACMYHLIDTKDKMVVSQCKSHF